MTQSDRNPGNVTRTLAEATARASNGSKTPTQTVQAAADETDDELRKRVKAALRRSARRPSRP